jgi:hypothetical protein
MSAAERIDIGGTCRHRFVTVDGPRFIVAHDLVILSWSPSIRRHHIDFKSHTHKKKKKIFVSCRNTLFFSFVLKRKRTCRK